MFSLAMIVKNEANNISRCLESAKSLVDEVVIVDTGSTDTTKEIALSFGARIFDYKWNNSFSDARNFALKQCRGDWLLVLDADEYIVDGSKNEINQFLQHKNNVIGRIQIINKFFQNGQTMEYQAFVSRLIPRDVFFEGRVHEQIVSTLPRENAPIRVYHDYKTEKNGRYLFLLQAALKETPKDSYLLWQIGKEYKILKDDTKAQKYFEKCYRMNDTLKYTFWPQLIVDYLYSVIGGRNFSKGLEIIEREARLLSDFTDFHFVSGLFFMELVLSDIQRYKKFIPVIEQSYLTCLTLGETLKYDGVLGTGSFMASYNLAVFYECFGDISKAKKYYNFSASSNYEPACKRIRCLAYSDII